MPMAEKGHGKYNPGVFHTMTSFPLRLASTAIALVFGFTVPEAFATTTIHNNGFTASNQPLPNRPNYGSNVAAAGANWAVSAGEAGVVGTPGIQLIWDGEGGGGANGGLDTYLSWNGRGNVVQLDGTGTGGTPNTFISFVPAPAVSAKIVSFDLDAWAGWPLGGNMTVEWTIRDSTKTGTALANGTWTRTTGGRDTVSPSYTGTPGQTLVLQLTRTAGNGDYLALDNLTFDEISLAPSIATFTSAHQVAPGSPFDLNWNITNFLSATSLTVSDGTNVTNVLPLTDGFGFGSFEVNPSVNTTYTLTLNGTITAQVSVLAGRAVALTSSAVLATSPSHEVTLQWTIEPPGAALVTIADGVTVHDVTTQTDSLTGTGSATFSVPLASTTFILEANGSGSTRSVRVLREQSGSGDFAINAPVIAVGSPLTVTWNNAVAGPSDWIGIYNATNTPGVQISTQWNYLNGTRTIGGSFPSGSMVFNGLAAGDYYICLFLNDGYQIAQGPLKFTVAVPQPDPEPIRVLEARRDGNQFILEWESRTGYTYDVYASPVLQGNPPVDWTPVATGLPADGDGSNSHTENLGVNPPERRFYVVRESPVP